MKTRGLKIGGRIDRYIASLFLSSYATAFMLVVGLFLILDMASNLDEYLETWPDGSRAPTVLIARYYVLHIPFLFLQVAPFVTLVSGLFTVTKLLKHNETVAMLASGVSAHRMLMPVFVGAAMCAVMMFGLREALSFTLASKRDAYKYILEHKQYDQVYHHIWLRDMSGTVIHLTEFRPAVGSPPAAEVRGLEATSRLRSEWSNTTAERAVFTYKDGTSGWWLEKGELRRNVEARGEQEHRAVDHLEGFDFTPELALTFFRARENALDLSFAEARQLAQRDPDNVIYRTLLQYHLTFPLANLVLLLVGLPIVLRHDPSKRAEGLAAGCILCIFYFGSDFVCRNLGLQGALEPKLAAWLPVLFFGSLGVVLFDSMKS